MMAAHVVQHHRQRLRDIADKIRAERAGRESLCRRAAEWLAMPAMHRMAVLLLAGIDGDLAKLSRRSWAEFTTPEKIAVQVAIRSLKTSLNSAYALSVRAG